MKDNVYKNSVVAIGSLREDIYLKHNFTRPMKSMEIKLNTYSRRIGGSVYNTCYYLSHYGNNLSISMYTPNYKQLIKQLPENQSKNFFDVITEGQPIQLYPISIIGVDESGEKRMISSDGGKSVWYLNTDSVKQKQGNVFYSSFYEINETNIQAIVDVYHHFIKKNLYTIVDLCPIIDKIDEKVIREILNNISVLTGNITEYGMLTEKLKISKLTLLFKEFPNIKTIWIKCGAVGAKVIVFDNGSYTAFESNPPHICTVLNTNGCGDVFNAIIINGIMEGWTIEKTLSEAVKESSLVAERGLYHE